MFVFVILVYIKMDLIIDCELIEFMDYLEEDFETIPIPRRHLINLDNPFEKYSNLEFLNRYRFSKEVVLDKIMTLFEKDSQIQRGLPVPKLLEITTTLRFFATGSFQVSSLTMHQFQNYIILMCLT